MENPTGAGFEQAVDSLWGQLDAEQPGVYNRQLVAAFIGGIVTVLEVEPVKIVPEAKFADIVELDEKNPAIDLAWRIIELAMHFEDVLGIEIGFDDTDSLENGQINDVREAIGLLARKGLFEEVISTVGA